LINGPVNILSKKAYPEANRNKREIIFSTRIGITKAGHLPLRFYINNNIFISKSLE